MATSTRADVKSAHRGAPAKDTFRAGIALRQSQDTKETGTTVQGEHTLVSSP